MVKTLYRTTSHTATLLDLSPYTIAKKCREGVLSSHLIGGKRLIPVTEIERLLRETERPRFSKEDKQQIEVVAR